MDHNDKELIKRTLAGDEAAFGALVDRYKDAVHALVYRKTGNFHIAEELTQDAFLQAYQKLSTLRNPAHFAGWLYVIASRCCLMWYRKKRLPTSPLAKVKPAEMETIAQRDYRDEQQRQEVHDALDSLPESQRTVLTLHYLGGLSCKEIGRFIGTSEGAIKDRLYRARLRLREEITNMMQETLRGFQLPPTCTQKLLERISNLEPTSTRPRGQPLIPWGVTGAVTITLIICASFTNGIRFQLPYSFNAKESATIVEVINAPIVDRAPLPPNRRSGQVVFQAAAQKEQDDAQPSLSYQDYQKWHLPERAKARLGKGAITQGDRAIVFSPDGAHIAVSSNIGIWLYDVKTGRELALLDTDSIWGHALAFSPDGMKLAATDGPIKLWDVSTQRKIATFEEQAGGAVAFSPDGTKLASGSVDKTVKLWDVSTGKNINTLTGHTELPRSVAFSPDGTKLASGSVDKTIKVWDVSTGKNINTLTGHKDRVESIAFSPDGTKLASGSVDRTVKLWDASTGENINTLGGTGSTSAAVRMLQIFAGRTSKSMGRRSPVTSVAFSPDGTTLASGELGGMIKLWDVATGRNINTLHGPGGLSKSVAFSPDGTKLASSISGGYGTVEIWEVATGKNINTIAGHLDGVQSIVFSPDGTKLAAGLSLAVGLSGAGVKLWEIETGQQIAPFSEKMGSVMSVAFSPDGVTLASAPDGLMGIKLWDIETGRNIATLHGSRGRIWSVVFSPDGARLASGSEDKNVKLWKVDTGENTATLRGHTDGVHSVAFSPDGTKLVSGSEDKTVKLWDVGTGRNIATLEAHTGEVWSVAFSPDGTKFASGSADKTVRLWAAKTLKNIATLEGHRDWVWSVMFSPNGTKLASGSDNTVEIWDVETGKHLDTFQGDGRALMSVAFSPDGTKLVSGASTGPILVWEISDLID